MFVKVVSDIEAGGLGEWPEPCLRDALSSLEVARARLDAAQALVLAELVGRGRVPETMVDTKIGLRDATRRTKTARALTDGSLPGASDALASGAIAFEHVAALAEAREHLPEGAVAMLLEKAKVSPPDKFRRAIRQASIPREHVADAATGKTADGRRWFRFDFGTVDGAVVLNALDEVIDQQWRDDHPERSRDKVDVPPYGHRLAQALLEMCRRTRHGTVKTPVGGWTRPSPEVGVILFYDKMVADATAAGIATTIDGEPIPAGVLRKLLVDARVYPIVLGSDGEVLDLGRSRRFFTAAQKKALAVRDGTCQFADCDKPARYTDAHHTVPWANGGLTDLVHGALVCDDDHDKLTNGGYRVERHNGSIYTYDSQGSLIYVRTNRWRK